jgi:hypothetical protein
MQFKAIALLAVCISSTGWAAEAPTSNAATTPSSNPNTSSSSTSVSTLHESIEEVKHFILGQAKQALQTLRRHHPPWIVAGPGNISAAMRPPECFSLSDIFVSCVLPYLPLEQVPDAYLKAKRSKVTRETATRQPKMGTKSSLTVKRQAKARPMGDRNEDGDQDSDKGGFNSGFDETLATIEAKVDFLPPLAILELMRRLDLLVGSWLQESASFLSSSLRVPSRHGHIDPGNSAPEKGIKDDNVDIGPLPALLGIQASYKLTAAAVTRWHSLEQQRFQTTSPSLILQHFDALVAKWRQALLSSELGTVHDSARNSSNVCSKEDSVDKEDQNPEARNALRQAQLVPIISQAVWATIKLETKAQAKDQLAQFRDLSWTHLSDFKQAAEW